MAGNYVIGRKLQDGPQSWGQRGPGVRLPGGPHHAVDIDAPLPVPGAQNRQALCETVVEYIDDEPFTPGSSEACPTCVSRLTR